MAFPQFTQPPWQFVDGEIRDADGRVLALLKTKSDHLPASHWEHTSYITEGEHRGNGRLIAAAPDLYAALGALVGYVDDNPPACVRGLLNDARAALSKAEGK